MRLIQTGLLKRLVGLAVGASAVLLFGVGANAQFRFKSQFNSQFQAQFQASAQFRPATNLQTLEGSTERPLIRVQSSGRAKGPESERVEADVSTRSVSITSSFTGVEIVVFGAIDNAQTLGPEAGLYDIVVVVKGRNQTLTVRQKNWRAGIWINTRAVKFDGAPSYYAITSTRALDELADPFVLRQNDIGFNRIPMRPVDGWSGLTSGELEDFRQALIRLKQSERLFQRDDYGVVFVGRNLFRATIDLPANVPVGPLTAYVHLLRDGQLIDTFTTQVTLERQGLERYLYNFAFGQPLLYGIFCVFVAVLAGLTASAVVQRMRRG